MIDGLTKDQNGEAQLKQHKNREGHGPHQYACARIAAHIEAPSAPQRNSPAHREHNRRLEDYGQEDPQPRSYQRYSDRTNSKSEREHAYRIGDARPRRGSAIDGDRKSTRLNSSHL